AAADRHRAGAWPARPLHELVCGKGAHVVAGLRPRFDAPLALELEVGLAHRGDAHPDTLAHAAQGREPVAGAQRPGFDVAGDQVDHLPVEVVAVGTGRPGRQTVHITFPRNWFCYTRSLPLQSTSRIFPRGAFERWTIACCTW